MLTIKDKKRYSRHILLDEVGELGQQKLKSAKVLVIGCGGLGCPILQYLAAAGIGKLGIIDDDRVDIRNLQRQILFTENHVGTLKVEAAKEVLSRLNSQLKIETYWFLDLFLSLKGRFLCLIIKTALLTIACTPIRFQKQKCQLVAKWVYWVFYPEL